MNNASPGQQGCCFPLLSRETCCKCYICCFPYSAGIVPAKVPFMEPLLYFVVRLAAGSQHAKRAKFHFMVPFLAMAKLERARFCAWLIESVVTCCKSCICCFSLLSRDCPREDSIHGTLVVFCCLPCSRIATRVACKVVTCCKCCICCFPLLSRDCPREGSIHAT